MGSMSTRWQALTALVLATAAPSAVAVRAGTDTAPPTGEVSPVAEIVVTASRADRLGIAATAIGA